MEKLLIVDGMNLLFQMFYGMPARIPGADGRPIHGTLGFVGALLKILRWEQPSHVAVLFDGECTNVRTEVDGNYKANRPDYSGLPEEETPFSQLPDIFRALDDLGISHAETSRCEADDWIAGYALTYGADMDTVIVSYDSDFFQLIGKRVRVLRYRGEKTVVWDEDCLMEKLGVQPGQYADFKALTGDNADNLRGAGKVGPKTAAKLLAQFGTLENLLQNLQSVRQPSLRASLEAAIPRLRTNYLLIKLSANESLPFTLDQLTYTPQDKTTRQVLQSIGVMK